MKHTREWAAERSTHYSNRLRDLVTEALQDGVVLAIHHEPEKLGFNINTPADWLVDVQLRPIPLSAGVRHEHLRNPVNIESKVVVKRELAEQQPEGGGILYNVEAWVPDAPERIVPPKTPEMEPTYNGSNLFVNPSLVQPWPTQDNTRMTSALAFGNMFDYIGLCTDPVSLDMTGRLDAAVVLDKVWYQLAGSDTVFCETVSNKPFSGFVADTLGDYSTLKLDFEFGQARNEKVLKARIYGKVNLQTGTLEVNCAQLPESELKLVGYKLIARTVNPNFR